MGRNSHLFPQFGPDMQFPQLFEKVPASAQHASTAIPHIPWGSHHETAAALPGTVHAQQAGRQSNALLHGVPGQPVAHVTPAFAAP